MCASDDFSSHRAVYFYIFCHQKNQIHLMMSLTNLVLNPDPLVHTLFTLFLCVFTSMLLVLVFGVLTILHQQESIPKVVDSLHYFGAQITDFLSKFQNHFYSYSLTLHSQRLQPLYFFKNIIWHTPIGDMCRPSKYGGGVPETGAFIQCVNGRDTKMHELW